MDELLTNWYEIHNDIYELQMPYLMYPFQSHLAKASEVFEFKMGDKLPRGLGFQDVYESVEATLTGYLFDENLLWGLRITRIINHRIVGSVKWEK